MSPGVRRYLEFVPHGPTVRALVEAFAQEGPGYVSATSPLWIAPLSSFWPMDGLGKVLSFEDLLAELLGPDPEAAPRTLADEAEVRDAVREACRVLAAESAYGASRDFPGFHRRLHLTLAELREAGILPSDLHVAAEALDAHDPFLAAKLRELARLEMRVRGVLDALGRRLPRVLGSPPALADSRPMHARVLVVVHAEVDAQTLRWLDWIAEIGVELTLASEAAGNREVLLQTRALPQRFRAVPERLAPPNALLGHLFGESAFEAGEPGVRVRKLTASDPLAEVEWALRRALEHHQLGTPWERIGLLARRLEEVAPLVRVAARQFGVPLDLPEGGALAEQPFVGWILRLLEAGNQEPIALAACADAPYADLTRIQRAALEMAAHASMPTEDPWSAFQPDVDPGWIQARMHYRVPWADAEQTFGEWVAELSEWLTGDWIDNALASTDRVQARDTAARDALVEALRVRARVLSGAEDPILDFGEMVAVVQDVVLRNAYRTPSDEGGLRVLSSATGLEELDHLLVLGMLEGVFPRRRTEDPVLADIERDRLNQTLGGRKLLPTSHETSAHERNAFLRVCGAASKTLQFSYALADEDRDNVPAFYLAEVARALGGPIETENHERGELFPADPKLPADLRVAKGLASPREGAPPNTLETDMARSVVRGTTEKGLSPADLRDALICPFRFTFRRLNVPTDREIPTWRQLVRLPIEAGLLMAPTPEDATRRLHEALDEQIEQRGDRLEAAEVALLRSGGRRVIRDWVEREFKVRQKWPRDPDSLRFRPSFGDEGLSDTIPVSKIELKLRGGPTAISRQGEYVVVHLMGARSDLVRTPNADKLSPPDRLEIGIYLMAAYQRGVGLALEVEGMQGERALWVLPPSGANMISQESDRAAGLHARTLSADKSEFLQEVKALLAEVVALIQSANVEARPGDACETCDFGEFCRQSMGFPDDDPFDLGGEDELG